MEFAYLLIMALIHLIFVFFWNTKVLKRPFGGRVLWLFCALSSVILTWGIEALEKVYGVESLSDVFQVSFGSWLVFVFATSAKSYAIKKWPMKDFWMDYGGELIGFFIIGFGLFFMG